MYEIDLSGPCVVAGPVHLPAELVGLADESLADLSAALDPCPDRFRGRGFWSAVPEAPVYDPETQRLSGQSDETPDAVARVVVVTPLVVNLTPSEIAARDAARLEASWAEIRAERDRRLHTSDLESLVLWADRWAAQTDEWRAAWTVYRQTLRDLPETYAAGPQTVIWPDPPSITP